MGFLVWGLGFLVWGLGFLVLGLGFRVCHTDDRKPVRREEEYPMLGSFDVYQQNIFNQHRCDAPFIGNSMGNICHRLCESCEASYFTPVQKCVGEEP